MTAIQPDREIVLVDCPDAVGLIHRITGVLEQRRLNIEANHEFVDPGAGHFFFRAEVVPAGPPVAAAALEGDLAAVLPPGARVRVTRQDRRPIVVCAAREPHCLGELLLLDACGELPGRIVAVVSNHDLLRSLVERFGVPFHHVSHEGLQERLLHLYPNEAEREAQRPQYVERLEFELNTILKMGFPGYFLIVGDFIQWAKKNGCPVAKTCSRPARHCFGASESAMSR